MSGIFRLLEPCAKAFSASFSPQNIWFSVEGVAFPFLFAVA